MLFLNYLSCKRELANCRYLDKVEFTVASLKTIQEKARNPTFPITKVSMPVTHALFFCLADCLGTQSN